MLLSVAEVAALLGRSRGYVRRLAAAGDLPVAQTGPNGRGGRPTAWFDPGAVFAMLHVKPGVSRQAS